MRKLILIAVITAITVGLMVPASAAEPRPAPASGTFSGQGTPLDMPEGTTASCWTYTVPMKYGAVTIWWGYHDITWCASAGKITSIIKGCRQSATFPWQPVSCTKGTNTYALPRATNSIAGATWTYCFNAVVGCAFHGGFRDVVNLNAFGGVGGSWWSW